MKNDTKLTRRHFLIAAGAGGAATAVAIASRTITPDEPKTTVGDDKRRGRGYQDTAHVRSYYNTTKV